MSLVSNQTWAGYQAWAERVGYLPSYDTKGPWLDYTGAAGTSLYSIIGVIGVVMKFTFYNKIFYFNIIYWEIKLFSKEFFI